MKEQVIRRIEGMTRERRNRWNVLDKLSSIIINEKGGLSFET